MLGGVLLLAHVPAQQVLGTSRSDFLEYALRRFGMYLGRPYEHLVVRCDVCSTLNDPALRVLTANPSNRHLFISRLFLGLGIGPKSATVPILAAEISPAAIRGSLEMQWQTWTAFGPYRPPLPSQVCG